MTLATFVVKRNGKEMDTVHYAADMNSEEVRRSLISHDGYPSDIQVIRSRQTPTHTPSAEE